MIVDAILEWINDVVEWLLGLLPDWAPPDITGGLSSLGPLWGYLSWANKYVPLVEIAAICATLLTYFIGLYLFRFTVWLLERLHILGG